MHCTPAPACTLCLTLKRCCGQRALSSFETAFALKPTDARVLFELDQLYKKLNRAPAERQAHLEQHAGLAIQRDDLTIERISLLNLLGRPDEAFELLSSRNFHPWEGGLSRSIHHARSLAP